jgi:hypothetical protein
VSWATGSRARGPLSSSLREGISYAASDKVKSEIYSAFLPVLNSRRVDLLDDRRLVAQLLGLERRTSWGGKDSVDHGPNAHDDLINSAAGALLLAVGEEPLRLLGGALTEADLQRLEEEAQAARARLSREQIEHTVRTTGCWFPSDGGGPSHF